MLRWLRRLSARPPRGGPGASVAPGPLLLEAYLLPGRRPGSDPLEPRLELLVGQLSAELSGCRWCIEGGRHRARKAGLPAEAIASLPAPAGARCFSEREQAALALAAAVAAGAATDGLVPGPALAAARRHFSEREIVRLTVLAAGEHFGDCLAARLGMAARPSFPIAARGLS
ncbi:MAG: carboxymuconolactone decarboxylase family protein [Deltaproteobacteria bacterium]